MNEPPPEFDEPAILDVSGLSFADLAHLPGAAKDALERSLQRIRAGMESPQDAVAGFQSST